MNSAIFHDDKPTLGIADPKEKQPLHHILETQNIYFHFITLCNINVTHLNVAVYIQVCILYNIESRLISKG